MTGRLGALLTGGVDLWLNTPKRPYEASGTSGMKAALNGVPSLSILDGWWIEGCNEGVTGWAIGDHDEEIDEANSLYQRLEQVILPLFYGQHDAWRRIMRSAIAINGSYFNTQRMLKQYVSEGLFWRAATGGSPSRGTGSGLLVSRLVQIRFFSWPIWTTHEAFTDPKRLGKRLSNDEHGFSRARKWPTRLTALEAAEVRLSKLKGEVISFRCVRHKRCRLVWASGLLLRMHFSRPPTPATERASIQQDRGIFRLWPPLAL